MKRFLLRFLTGSLPISCTAMAVFLLSRTAAELLHIRRSEGSFAGQKAGILTWSGKHGKAVYCSTHYHPDEEEKTAVKTAAAAVCKGIAALWMLKGCKKSTADGQDSPCKQDAGQV